MLSVYALVLRTSLAFVLSSCIGQLQWAWFSSNPRPLYDLVRYDSAGRGARGALAWLGIYHIRQPLTALGAVLTVIAIVLDPFFQQLIRPVDCSVSYSNEAAILPRTNLLDFNYLRIGSENDLQSLVMMGALGDDYASAECSTGNCTFTDVYTTLGYCSQCEDVSDSLSSNITCTDSSANITSQLIPAVTDCPSLSGVQIASNLSSRVGTTWPFALLAMELTGSTAEALLQFDLVVGGTTASRMGLDPFTANNLSGCSDPSTSTQWQCRGYGAARCTLQPCVRTYNATVVNGQTLEALVETPQLIAVPDLPFDNFARSWYDFGLLNTTCPSSEDRTLLLQRGILNDTSSQWVYYNDSFPLSDLTESLLSQECLYLFENVEDIGTPLDFLEDLLGGTASALAWEPTGSLGIPVISEGLHGEAMPNYVYDYGNVSLERIQNIFNNVSNLITWYVRTNGNASFSQPATGRVLHYATCLEVRWAWIAFPAALTAALVAFFAAVVVATARRRLLPWKSSPLAWLMRGPERYGDGDEDSEDAVTTAEMEQKAKGILVSLADGPRPRIQVVRSGRKGGPKWRTPPEDPTVTTSRSDPRP